MTLAMDHLATWLVRVLVKLGFQPRVTPMPEAPKGAVAYVLYRKKDNPQYGMLCWRFADGRLVTVGREYPWMPDEQWTLDKEGMVR